MDQTDDNKAGIVVVELSKIYASKPYSLPSPQTLTATTGIPPPRLTQEDASTTSNRRHGGAHGLARRGGTVDRSLPFHRHLLHVAARLARLVTHAALLRIERVRAGSDVRPDDLVRPVLMLRRRKMRRQWWCQWFSPGKQTRSNGRLGTTGGGCCGGGGAHGGMRLFQQPHQERHHAGSRHLQAVRAQRLTDRELVARIVYCFWGQLLILQTIYYVLESFVGFWPAFQTATWNPFSRLPVFMMGVYAGLLVLRHPLPLLSSSSGMVDGDQQQQQQQQHDQDTMPWAPCFLGMWPVLPSSSIGTTTTSTTTTTTTTSCCRRPATPTSTAEWSRLATRQSLGLLTFTLVVGALNTFLRIGLGSPSGVSGAPWMQSIVAMTQLNIIVAVTRDGGTSLASKALRTPFAAWLGKLSMNVYMVHMPVILYFVFLVLRKAKPNPFDCRLLLGRISTPA